MSDYVSCPACKGKGLVPVEDANRITEHANAEYALRQQLKHEREVQMHKGILEQQLAAAEERQRRLLIERAVLSGSRTEEK